MTDLIEKYLNKECLIYTMGTISGSPVTGTIKEIQDGWITIENGGTEEILNIDYIVRIREYPRTKRGKKKSVIMD